MCLSAVGETGVAFAGVVGAARETGVAFAGVNGPVLGGWSRAVVSRVSSASVGRRAVVLWVSSASASRRALVLWVSRRAVLLEPSQSVSSAQQYAVWEFKDGMSHAPIRSSSSSVSLLCADGDQYLGDDLVDDAQIRPTDTNDCPPGAFEVSLSTLLGLNAVVDFIDRIPVFDAPVEFDSDLQVGQCNIDEVRVVGNLDLFLSRHSFDPRAQQREEDQGLAGRLTSSVGTINHPSSPLASDGVEGSASQGLVEFSARLLLAGTRLILMETIKLARPGQPCAGDGKPVLFV